MAKVVNKNLINYDPLVEWNAERANSKLDELCAAVVQLTDSTIAWYDQNRKTKGKAARIIRIIAIILFIITTTAPIFSLFVTDNKYILYAGYLFAALAGGVLAFDRFYGLSNSWIRFVLTGQELARLRNSFILSWQVLSNNSSPISKRNFAIMVEALHKYQDTFSETVKSETEQWAHEYRQNLKDLMAAIQTQSEQFNTEINALKIKQKSASQIAEAGESNVPIEIIQEAIAKKFDEWRQTFNVQAVAAGKKVIEKTGDVLDINCLVFSPIKKIKPGDEDFIKVPDFITFSSSNGRTYEIPTDVRAEGSEIYASSANPNCDNALTKRPGCSISRQITVDSSGTLGLKVYRGNRAYLLGCYHVLCGPELNLDIREFSATSAAGNTHVVSPSVQDGNETSGVKINLGPVIEGYFSNQFDCAIALLDNAESVVDSICQIDRVPKIPLTVTEDHAAARYRVVAVGRSSGKVKGRIQDASTSCAIHYWIKDKWRLVNFSGVVRTDQLTIGGDSGAPVLDNDNNVIGIVIANSSTFTYILPIQRILAKLSVTLKPSI